MANHRWGWSIDGHDALRRDLMGYDSDEQAQEGLRDYLAALEYVRCHPEASAWFANMNRQLNNGIDLTERQVASVLMCIEADARRDTDGQ